MPLGPSLIVFRLCLLLKGEEIDHLDDTEAIDDQHDEKPAKLIVSAGTPETNALPDKLPYNKKC
jgi:hypothetical protein